jgi:hypothetical protein
VKATQALHERGQSLWLDNITRFPGTAQVVVPHRVIRRYRRLKKI